MDDLAAPLDIAPTAPLTPETLRALLRIDYPSNVITVQGVARETKLWSKGGASFVFGRLALGGASVKFRSPPELAPTDGEAVTMRGSLQITHATSKDEDWRATHEILFIASVLGTWEARHCWAGLYFKLEEFSHGRSVTASVVRARRLPPARASLVRR